MFCSDDLHNIPNTVAMVETGSRVPLPFLHRASEPAPQQQRMNAAWMFHICQQVIYDMDHYGVCVVDNLLGEERGANILKEVYALERSGAFQDGQVVKQQQLVKVGEPGGTSYSGTHVNNIKPVREDKITWVDGREPICKNIAVLIALIDAIVMGANKIPNNGKLGNYLIKERTKAMVACYPGSGSQYVKHVDNPNRDGRCITSIYYLNKDWNTKTNGGLLRIFPDGYSNTVADIEPLFDRVLFFWSDRRNPHEVQPAFKTRYAITLWYFDAKEKEEARLRPRES